MNTTRNTNRWLLYGATGYTGRLIAQRAVEKGFKPILAGRDLTRLEAIGKPLGLESRVFSLNSSELESMLKDVDLVLHCAGPFSKTSAPMVDACLKTKKHYLDITGEISVFEACAAKNEAAKTAGVVILPGTGFDVVPSDCLAATLAKRLPGATSLSLAFAMSGGGISPGTMKTMVESLNQGGCVRRDGKLTKVGTFEYQRRVGFLHRELRVGSIPWGDVSTAFYSTGIPNITCYTAVPRTVMLAMKAAGVLSHYFMTKRLQELLQTQIGKRVSGPDKQARKQGRSYFWGEVKLGTQTEEAVLVAPEGYALTVETALLCVEGVLAGGVPAGFQTPSRAFGPDFIAKVPGVEMRLL